MGGMELLLIATGWLLPLAAVIFLVTSLMRITRSLRAIEHEVGEIREVLERERTSP